MNEHSLIRENQRRGRGNSTR